MALTTKVCWIVVVVVLAAAVLRLEVILAIFNVNHNNTAETVEEKLILSETTPVISTERIQNSNSTIIESKTKISKSTTKAPTRPKSATTMAGSRYWNSPLLGESKEGGAWNCCIDPLLVNPLRQHPAAQEVQDRSHDYSCPKENASNFSWYYEHDSSVGKVSSTSSSTAAVRKFDRLQWKHTSIVFVGGSTTRQIMEQYRWEMPHAAQNSKAIIARFLFHHIQVGNSRYGRHDVLDLNKLDPTLEQVLVEEKPDFIVVNVGTWWDTDCIGHVLDNKGQQWSIGFHDPHNKRSEWQVRNKTRPHFRKPNVTFAALMKRALQMMLVQASPKTTIVWRS